VPSSFRLTAVAALCLAALALSQPGPAAADPATPPQPDALIGGAESLAGHEAAFENIDTHEARPQALDAHEASFGNIDDHEGHFGNIQQHEAASESLAGRSVPSERLFGMQNDPEQALTAAREELLNARQRHQRAVVQAEKTLTTPQAAPVDADGTWPQRLEMAEHRILVAQANLRIHDKAYADMLRDDYPRGQARQDLIDSRKRALQRLLAEKAQLPRLVEQAREAGVSQSLLAAYEPPN